MIPSDDRLSAELLNALGERDFLTLVEARGGTRLYVPAGHDSMLMKMIGEAATEALARRYGGSYIRVPLARERRARHYRAAGLSNAQIAVRLGITESGVDALFRRMPDKPRKGHDPRQADLFS